MTAQKYNSAIRLTTLAAMKAGLSIPEVIGVLEMAKANVIQIGISKMAQEESKILHVPAPVPPGLEGGN